MGRENVHELLKSHKIEFITGELQRLQEVQHITLANGLSSDKDEVRESAQSSLVKEKCDRNGGMFSYLWKSIIRTPC